MDQFEEGKVGKGRKISKTEIPVVHYGIYKKKPVKYVQDLGWPSLHNPANIILSQDEERTTKYHYLLKAANNCINFINRFSGQWDAW
jgi:hypothetical protein